MKLIGALAVKKKEQIGYLEYSLLMIKINCISPPGFWDFSFFESQRDQGVTHLDIKPLSISQTSRIVSLS